MKRITLIHILSLTGMALASPPSSIAKSYKAFREKAAGKLEECFIAISKGPMMGKTHRKSSGNNTG